MRPSLPHWTRAPRGGARLARVRVVLATCPAARGLDEDEPLLLAALARAGAEAGVADWAGPGEAFAGADVVCLRSTWDYPARPAAFLEWVARTAARTVLVNPPAAVGWSIDKASLVALAEAGIPVVPTVALTDDVPLPGWPEVVVKPRIGAGAVGQRRTADPGRARAHARALAASGRGAVVQPYLPGVEERGETALVHLGGAFSHAVRKGPLLAREAAPHTGLFAEEDIAARTPDAAERALAERVMAHLGPRLGPLAYARVDLLPAPDGPRVLEVELAEPSLFLAHAPGAADRLARVLIAHGAR